jgi:hypothetical protein
LRESFDKSISRNLFLVQNHRSSYSKDFSQPCDREEKILKNFNSTNKNSQNSEKYKHTKIFWELIPSTKNLIIQENIIISFLIKRLGIETSHEQYCFDTI